jgi:L-fucose isomerase-like protein
LQFNEINKKAWIGFNEANDHRCKIGYLKIIQNNSQLLLELLGFNHNEVSREELIKFLKYVDEKTGDMESNPEELADDLIKEAEIVKIGNKMPREYDKVIDNWASEEEGLDEINNEQVISNS